MVRFSSSSVAAIDSQTPFSTSGTSISRLGIGFLAVRLWSGNLFYPIRREMSSMRTTPGGEEIDQPLDGRIRLMIRPLDLCRLRRAILRSVMEQGVRQWAADSFVKQNEHRPDPYPLR